LPARDVCQAVGIPTWLHLHQRGLQPCSWRGTMLEESSAPTPIKNTEEPANQGV